MKIQMVITRGALAALMLLVLFCAGGHASDVVTVWPFFDYRSSPQVGYSSLHMLGPLIKLEVKGQEKEFALRPLYYQASDEERGAGFSEVFYPVGTSRSEAGDEQFRYLGLIHGEDQEEGERSYRSFSLFPLVFYEDRPEGPDYFALFPLGGRILNRFGRDRIDFALFPLYSRTWKKGTETTNILWPVFASIEGEKERGGKVWPLAGFSQKEGVYRKRFLLWPFLFSEDLGLDTDNPVSKRAFFPLFIKEDSPRLSSRTVLWPFFQHLEDRQKGYAQYDFPWPLFRLSDGADRKVRRFLPLYAHEQLGDRTKAWAFWPLYKFEGLDTEIIQRQRHRVLFFLYSDLRESVHDQSRPDLRRVALWPLFSYTRRGGVSHFHTLSLLEPFFPDSGGLERNWAPLWRLYQTKWDQRGNEVSTFLWNLYWKERRGEDLMYEVFPLIRYGRQGSEVRSLSLLKGLFRYERDDQGSRIGLFYLPWEIPLKIRDANSSSAKGES